MIIFLQRIADIVMDSSEGGEGTKEDQNGYRILVTSMTVSNLLGVEQMFRCLPEDWVFIF